LVARFVPPNLWRPCGGAAARGPHPRPVRRVSGSRRVSSFCAALASQIGGAWRRELCDHGTSTGPGDLRVTTPSRGRRADQPRDHYTLCATRSAPQSPTQLRVVSRTSQGDTVPRRPGPKAARSQDPRWGPHEGPKVPMRPLYRFGGGSMVPQWPRVLTREGGLNQGLMKVP